jgi:hypothetical protein
MGKKARKRGSKLSEKNKNKPSKLKNKNVESGKITQTKYHHLNMKVQDMVRALGLDSEQINFIDNPDKIKMSAVILKLAEPYIKMYWGNEIRVRGIIFLAIMVWNMTFLPQKEQIELQEKWIEDVLPNDCDAQDVAAMLHVFERLQKRQRDLFPNIRTFIMEHDLRLDSENIHLDISSVPLGNKKMFADLNLIRMSNE